jgi:hypothetical protein
VSLFYFLYRYHGGGVVTTVKTPSPEAGRIYLFEGILSKGGRQGLFHSRCKKDPDLFGIQVDHLK